MAYDDFAVSRVFNGERYHFKDNVRYKVEADQMAKQLRKEGKKVRVVKAKKPMNYKYRRKGGGKQSYSIYVKMF